MRGVVKRSNYLTTRYFGFRLAGYPTLTGYWEMKRDLRRFRRLAKEHPATEFPVTGLWPCLGDKQSDAGARPNAERLCVAQRIFRNAPRRHVDIGSSISEFAAHVAAFRTIDIFDIRPLDEPVSNMVFTQMDLMDLAPEYEQCTDSVSSLSVLEHFGLGRYGDPLCYDGHRKGFANITRMLKPGGKFYFSVPLGPQRIEFHAHRVFSMTYLLDWVGADYRVDSFCYTDDRGRFHEDVEITPAAVADNFGCHFGHALFELTKK